MTAGRPAPTILIVDDDPIGSEVIRQFLVAETGAEVDLAGNGRQAAQLIKSRDYALVITDLHMPETDGIEFMAVLAEVSPATPVMIVSGAPHAIVDSAVKLARLRGLRVAGTDLKPVNRTRLLAAVQAALK